MIFEGITVLVTDENGKPFEEYTNDPDLQQTNEISSTFVAIPDASESQYFKVKLTDSREKPFEKGFGIEAVFSIGMCRDADSNNAKITRYLHDNTKEVKFGGSSRLFFKKLTISEDEVDTDSTAAMEHGVIEIQIWRISKYRRVKRKDSTRANLSVRDPEIAEVSEKVLKGQDISHGVGLHRGPRGSHTTDRKRDTERPFHRFRIYYRTKSALQSRGLILKDGVRGIENAIEFQSQRNADAKELGGQVRELQTQQTAHENATRVKAESSEGTVKIKRERQDEGDTPGRQFKREKKIEVVDLTGED